VSAALGGQLVVVLEMVLLMVVVPGMELLHWMNRTIWKLLQPKKLFVCSYLDELLIVDLLRLPPVVFVLFLLHKAINAGVRGRFSKGEWRGLVARAVSLADGGYGG
jgi:hypothetical protein